MKKKMGLARAGMKAITNGVILESQKFNSHADQAGQVTALPGFPLQFVPRLTTRSAGKKSASAGPSLEHPCLQIAQSRGHPPEAAAKKPKRRKG
jgi:hypothetical protein